MSKKNLLIFPSLWEGIKELTNEQKGELFSALCLKFLEGEEPVITDDYVKFVFKLTSKKTKHIKTKQTKSSFQFLNN